ncbi:hypothetical protein MRB53_032315 [Persea americana]|uniref:Uncharacterized protein n=1 Tax=Persea americana TaxID=3435 RepID=A0ACC2KRV2_PERAE|nr:hypothetical protein MRB53_032315 [Persea americana]
MHTTLSYRRTTEPIESRCASSRLEAPFHQAPPRSNTRARHPYENSKQEILARLEAPLCHAPPGSDAHVRQQPHTDADSEQNQMVYAISK